MKHITLLLTAVLALFVSAQDLKTGEWAYQLDGSTPAVTGQSTHDHLFTRNVYSDTGSSKTYDGTVSFKSGYQQVVEFWLDDDEIYNNAAVQALPKVPCYDGGDELYSEITYNSAQFNIYLPLSMKLIKYKFEGEKRAIDYQAGDRMPYDAMLQWQENANTKVIDGIEYRVYTVTISNTKNDACHFSGNEDAYAEHGGALKKDDGCLFRLAIENTDQQADECRLADMIVANQEFNFREAFIAGWSPNNSRFFYGTGGNNVEQRYQLYYRVALYGSQGIDDTPGHTGDNAFSVQDAEAMHGDTIMVPVVMTNSDQIIAFQTDVYLPDGFEIVKEDGEYAIELSERKSKTHVVMANDMNDGAVRILSYSPNLKPFTGNDGVLFYIPVKVPLNIDGTYVLQLKNSFLTNIDEDEVGIQDVSCNLEVHSFIPGDANNSGKVTVTDVVVTAKYVLNYNPQPFVFAAADMNGDNKISVTDVVKIAHLVLDGDLSSYSFKPAGGNLPGNDCMSGNDVRFTSDCDVKPVSIALNNELSYTAFQFDMTLPVGVEASNFALTGRTASHLLGVNTLDNGDVRVLCYSPDVNSIMGSEGAVLTFDLTATSDKIIRDLEVKNIEMVTPQGQDVALNNFNIKVHGENVPISVDEVNAAATRISAQDRNIIVDSPVDQAVCVVDMLGRVHQVKVKAGHNVILVADAGIYAVVTGATTVKLIIK